MRIAFLGPEMYDLYIKHLSHSFHSLWYYLRQVDTVLNRLLLRRSVLATSHIAIHNSFNSFLSFIEKFRSLLEKVGTSGRR